MRLIACRLRAALISPLLLSATLTGCEQATTGTPDYRPQDAGTVDHALCLLGFTAVPLRELVTGHHLVDVVLNGRAATFVLDTGANATVLHAPFAAEFDLTSEGGAPAGAIGLGGTLSARQVPIETLVMGGIAIRRDRIVTADLAQMTRLLGSLSDRKIYGILGQDVMKEHRAVIDVARPILYLVEADQDPAPIAPERCRGRHGRPKGTAAAP
jgi:predicted aspartyl protease